MSAAQTRDAGRALAALAKIAHFSPSSTVQPVAIAREALVSILGAWDRDTCDSAVNASPPVRHVSGSILPSNEPRILAPVETPFGMLQVRVIEELDTHGLFHRHSNGESLLATHGNGYSCFNLLEKMVARDDDAVTRQAQHILDCGGTTRNLHHTRAALSAAKTVQP